MVCIMSYHASHDHPVGHVMNLLTTHGSGNCFFFVVMVLGWIVYCLHLFLMPVAILCQSTSRLQAHFAKACSKTVNSLVTMALAQLNTPRALLLAAERASNHAVREAANAASAVAFIAAEKAALAAEDARAAAVEAAVAVIAAEAVSTVAANAAAEMAAAAEKAQKVAKAAADEAAAARIAWNPLNLKRKTPLLCVSSDDDPLPESSSESVA